MEESFVVHVEVMNERGELWQIVTSGVSVDAAVAHAEHYANAERGRDDAGNNWVMNDWRAT